MSKAQGIAQSANQGQFKNRIINGAMMINQRGFSGTPTNGQYTLDRWQLQVSAANKLTVAQSSTAPTGFNTSLLVTSSSAYSVGAGDYFIQTQYIEGFNFADLGFGTASAQTVTLSFQVYSSLTGTFGGSLQNYAASRSYPFTYTISSANTWTTISVTIAGDTSGTWAGATNAGAAAVNFGFGVGTTLSGTAGAWASSNFVSATGATSVVGTNGATFYITGVQLEKGSTATSFDYRPYGTELALCQRYAVRYCGNSPYEDVNCSPIGYNSTTAYGAIYTVVPMRASPSVSSSTLFMTDNSSNITLTSIVASGASYSGPYNINVAFNAASGIVQYRPYLVNANNSLSAFVILSAEL